MPKDWLYNDYLRLLYGFSINAIYLVIEIIGLLLMWFKLAIIGLKDTNLNNELISRRTTIKLLFCRLGDNLDTSIINFDA